MSIGPGGRIAAMPRVGDLLVVDAQARRGMRLIVPEQGGHALDVQLTAGKVGTLRIDSTAATITVYRTEARQAQPLAIGR